MRGTRYLLLASACASTALTVATPRPARAEFLDTAAIAALTQVVKQYVSDSASQVSNYLKGQVAANQQTVDASNMAMARFQRDVRNAQIRDEHVVTPAACEALDNGQSVVVSAGNSWVVAASLARVKEPRGEAAPGMPAYYGAGQAVSAISDVHEKRYCGEAEAQAGVCRMTDRPNWDQRASSGPAPLVRTPQIG